MTPEGFQTLDDLKVAERAAFKACDGVRERVLTAIDARRAPAVAAAKALEAFKHDPSPEAADRYRAARAALQERELGLGLLYAERETLTIAYTIAATKLRVVQNLVDALAKATDHSLDVQSFISE